MKKFNFTKSLPFGFISLALAFGALGTGWTQYAHIHNGQSFSFSATWVPEFTQFFVCLFTLLITLKMIFNRKWFKDDLIKNQIASPHFGVYPLVLTSIGEFILPYQKHVGDVYSNSGVVYVLGMFFWYIGFIIQILFFFYWIYLESKNFKWENIDASWYVPPVALAGACTNPAWLGSGYKNFVQTWWYIVFVIFLVCLVFMWYRYLFIKGHESELPSIGILSSVNSFMLLTYSGAYTGSNIQFGTVFFLGATSLTLTLIIYVTMFKTFRGKFNAGLASYSFPLSASAAARLVFAGYMFQYTNNVGIYNFFLIWGFIELIIATIVNVYLFVGLTAVTVKGAISNYKIEVAKA